jgi:hypothetical protein
VESLLKTEKLLRVRQYPFSKTVHEFRYCNGGYKLPELAHALSRKVTQLYAKFRGSFYTNISIVVELFNKVLALTKRNGAVSFSTHLHNRFLLLPNIKSP